MISGVMLNLFQHPYRIRKQPNKQTGSRIRRRTAFRDDNEVSGFTLIELLVVVLIIGILAAVALPQYQKAVLKSRLGAVMSNVKTMKNALELYYLANGNYPNDDIREVDFEIPGCTSPGAGHLQCGDTLYDYNGGNSFGSSYVVIGYIQNLRISYSMYLDHSTVSPGRITCTVREPGDKVAINVCRNMAKRQINSLSWEL